MNKNIYWDIGVPLSYNCLYNFIVGERGVGKSYGAKKYVIKIFLEKGLQFGYVRRYKDELADAMSSFFNDIVVNGEYPEHEFKVEGKRFLVREKMKDEDGNILMNQEKNENEWREMGFGYILSTASKKKSESYPLVDFIIFDEFIIDTKGYVRYLPNEVLQFLNLYETIARMRDVKVFFLANAITFTNPYFLKFKVEPPTNKKRIRSKNDILIQYTLNDAYRTAKKATRFAKMLEAVGEEEFYSHSIENKMLRDSNDFILKSMPKKSRYLFTLKNAGEYFGVWRSVDEGKLWVSRKFEPSSKLVYTTMIDEHTPNTMLLKGGIRASVFDSFVKSYKLGLVYYDSIKTKNIVLGALSKTNKI